MTAKPTIHTIGGDKLATLLRGVLTEQGKTASLEVGFFESAKYPSGKGVPYIAAIHELGAPRRRIPRRPYFSKLAIPRMIDAIVPLVRAEIDPMTMRIPTSLLNRIGAICQGILQDAIVEMDQPPLSPRTIAARNRAGKGRRANKVFAQHTPLIDTGKFRLSATWKVTSSNVSNQLAIRRMRRGAP